MPGTFYVFKLVEPDTVREILHRDPKTEYFGMHVASQDGEVLVVDLFEKSPKVLRVFASRFYRDNQSAISTDLPPRDVFQRYKTGENTDRGRVAHLGRNLKRLHTLSDEERKDSGLTDGLEGLV